jgi:hypothetical protein
MIATAAFSPNETVSKDAHAFETDVSPYTLEVIRDEARYLVKHGDVDRQQPIYALCHFIPSREWIRIEAELERHEFLLRDRIIDLLAREEWQDD